MITMNILFVCLGNICRSPIAHGLLLKKFHTNGIEGTVDSAGFESFHINDSPDPRAIQTAQNHGIDISSKKARLFSVEDFDTFDEIYVMDLKNYRDVMYFARNEADKRKVDYIMNLISPGKDEAVPDPYYGTIDACEKVYQILDKATDVLVQRLKSKH